ncbi:MAG: FHA domain-containing protein [Bifidobacteriaceae bacterium]|nr:FHA domain-containing protein [Bifidobacteriaceae bacterium]
MKICPNCEAPFQAGSATCAYCATDLRPVQLTLVGKFDAHDIDTLTIPPAGTEIGRKIDFAREQLYLQHPDQAVLVSSKHCKIYLDNDLWYLLPYQTTNGTFWHKSLGRIQPLEPDQPFLLREGTVFALGSASFAFQVRFVKVIDLPIQPVVDEVRQFAWVITCPGCGTMYEVPDQSTRIDECQNCKSVRLKHQIANEVPVYLDITDVHLQKA